MSADLAQYLRGSSSLQGGLEGFTSRAEDKRKFALDQISSNYKNALTLAGQAFDKKEDLGRTLEAVGGAVGGVYASAKGIAKGVKKIRDKFKKRNGGDEEDDDLQNEDPITEDYDIDGLDDATDLGGDLDNFVSNVSETATEGVENATSSLGEMAEGQLNNLQNSISDFGQNIMNKITSGGNRTGYQARVDPRNMNEDMLDQEQQEIGEGDIEMTDMSNKEDNTKTYDQDGNEIETNPDDEVFEGTEQELAEGVDDTTEAITEAGTDATLATVDTVAEASQALDWVPILGEITMLLGIGATVGTGIYEAVKGSQDEKSADTQAKDAENAATAKVNAIDPHPAGTYTMPALNSMTNFER